jgi:exopolyphosphatase
LNTSWPPRDDEPLIRRWNEYGAVNVGAFDEFVNTSNSYSNSSQQQRWNFNCWHIARQNHSYQSHDSDVTEVHSNRRNDLHHRFNDHDDDDSFDDLREYSFLNDSSFHRRQRVHPSLLRIWHALSVLVVIVFCSSLVLMPSVLQQSGEGRWGGESHGHYKHRDVNSNAHNNGRDYAKGAHNENAVDAQDRQKKEGDDSQQQQQQWHYPKPWKYLFGMGNNDNDETAAGEANNQTNFNSSHVVNNGDETTTDTSSFFSDTNTNDDDKQAAASLANITFASLASLMLPPYLQTTVELCKSTILPHHPPEEVLSKSQKKQSLQNNNNNNQLDLSASTTSILPSSVFTLRKQLLKTRDLLDAFSPVYPPHETTYHEGDLDFATRDILYVNEMGLEIEKDGRFKSGSDVEDASVEGEWLEGSRRHGNHGTKKQDGHSGKYKLTSSTHHTRKEMDLWKTLRSHLNTGYTLIGSFQDLDHANIQYTPDQLSLLQRQVWEWHVSFMTFMERNYLLVMWYLEHPCPIEEELSEKHERGHSKQYAKSSKKRRLHHTTSTTTCKYTHSHSSHLFWGGMLSSELPDGSLSLAQRALGQLGKGQLKRAYEYLVRVKNAERILPEAEVEEPTEKNRMLRHDSRKKKMKAVHHESTATSWDPPAQEQDSSVHEMYHNLRKELRSFLDEVDLFGTLMLPDTLTSPEVIASGLAREVLPEVVDRLQEVEPVNTPPMINISLPEKQDVGPQLSPPIDSPPIPSSNSSSQTSHKQKTFDALTALKQTRKLLGDLNDDYTAYTTYVSWGTNRGEQVRLMSKIETEWNNFRWWANQIGLEGQMEYLMSRMGVDAEVDGAEDGASSSGGEPVDEGRDLDHVPDVADTSRENEEAVDMNNASQTSQREDSTEANPGQ